MADHTVQTNEAINLLVPVGSTVVTNGGFATDTAWTKGDGWTISSGEAHCDGTQGSNTAIYPPGAVLTSGKIYRISYDVTARSAGLLRITLGSGVESDFSSATGIHVVILTAPATSFFIQGDADFVGSIDNVSVVLLDNAVSYPSGDNLIIAGQSLLKVMEVSGVMTRNIKGTSEIALGGQAVAGAMVRTSNHTVTSAFALGGMSLGSAMLLTPAPPGPPSHTASGFTWPMGAMVLSGAVQLGRNATSAVDLGAMAVSASVSRSIPTAGALALGAQGVSGVASVTAGPVSHTATSAITLGGLTLSSTYSRGIATTGAIALGVMDLLGAALKLDLHVATSALTLGGMSVSGTASRVITATSALALGAMAVESVAEVEHPATSEVTLGAFDVSGAMTRTITMSSAVTMGAMVSAGEALRNKNVTASGAISMGALTTSAAMTKGMTATSGIEMASMTVSGTIKIGWNLSINLTMGSMAVGGRIEYRSETSQFYRITDIKMVPGSSIKMLRLSAQRRPVHV